MRNKEDDADYIAYAHLFADYEELKSVVRIHNQPVYMPSEDANEESVPVIPRIRREIYKLKEIEKTVNDSPEWVLYKAGAERKIAELEAYETHHIYLWRDMDAVIDALCKNKYVWRTQLPNTRVPYVEKGPLQRPNVVVKPKGRDVENHGYEQVKENNVIKYFVRTTDIDCYKNNLYEGLK